MKKTKNIFENGRKKITIFFELISNARVLLLLVQERLTAESLRVVAMRPLFCTKCNVNAVCRPVLPCVGIEKIHLEKVYTQNAHVLILSLSLSLLTQSCCCCW